MSKKLLVALLGVLVIALGVGIVYFYQVERVVHLSEEELQERIEEPFPISQPHMRILKITLSEPSVDLVEGSERLHYEMKVRAFIVEVGETP